MIAIYFDRDLFYFGMVDRTIAIVQIYYSDRPIYPYSLDQFPELIYNIPG